MTQQHQDQLKSNLFKVAIGVAVVWGVVTVAKFGYQFGQYLYGITH